MTQSINLNTCAGLRPAWNSCSSWARPRPETPAACARDTRERPVASSVIITSTSSSVNSYYRRCFQSGFLANGFRAHRNLTFWQNVAIQSHFRYCCLCRIESSAASGWKLFVARLERCAGPRHSPSLETNVRRNLPRKRHPNSSYVDVRCFGDESDPVYSQHFSTRVGSAIVGLCLWPVLLMTVQRCFFNPRAVVPSPMTPAVRPVWPECVHQRMHLMIIIPIRLATFPIGILPTCA